ncbi:MAG: ACT domain-containing protein [Candidatus Latescibacteria bacterium]|nr:ACT domain-containing protein [Candidatus Latescibacterota bacterium]
MKVKQISVFIENRSGRLLEVTDILGKNNINIRALSLADTSDYGILRLIVNNPDTALKVLKSANFTLSETDVIAVEVPDKSGGLAEVLKILDSSGINVEYMYAFVEKSSNNAVMIFRIENIDRAIETLKNKKIVILNNEQVYSL